MGRIEVERIGLASNPLDDVYHRLLKAPWSLFIVGFVVSYLLLNLAFGFAYYRDLAGIQNARPGSFADAFMFSVQTIATIGYGHLAPSSGYVNAIVVVESMTALLSLSLWSGLAFARFSRPTARVLFSNLCVVTNHNGVPTLMFRVANGRGNRIVDASISVILLRNERSLENVQMRRQHSLKLMRDRSPVFALSWTVMHAIDETSPLRPWLEGTRASALGSAPMPMAGNASDSTEASEPFDLVAALTGIDDTFSQTIHGMYAYRIDDVRLGHRLSDISGVNDKGRPVIDFRKFDAVEPDGAVPSA